MAHTEADLDRMINEVFDDYSNNNVLPYIRGMINTNHGRKRLFEAVKKMILEQGMTDIDAILVQFEESHDWNY